MKSLYIHIPFCTRKCLFCSFVVSIAQEHRADEYIAALMKEAAVFKGQEIASVYLGGGTPSVLTEGQMVRLVNFVHDHFKLSPLAEFSMEINPEGVNLSKALLWKSLGINRVSLGVQSLDDRYLKFLGRVHDRQKALEAFAILKKAGFENINVDLMYAYPKQNADEIGSDLSAIGQLDCQHLSLYTLTIEPNSRFYAAQMKLDDEETLSAHYQQVVGFLNQAGFKQYEVSNFSKEGFQSRHNMNYWLGGEYIGLGVGAHGYLNGRRYWNEDKLQDYLDRIIKEGVAIKGFEDLSTMTQQMEKVIFGLRMNQGIDVSLVPQQKKPLVDELTAQGFLTLTGNRLTVTDQGRLVLDEISSRLI